MGIRNRENYPDPLKSPRPGQSLDGVREQPVHQTGGRSAGGVAYLIFPVMTIAALWYGADAFLRHREASYLPTLPASVAILPSAQPQSDLPVTGGIVLKTDQQGHFRGTALINNVAMPFLIDTGATRTVIPRDMAIKAGLPLGKVVQSHTAGGRVSDRATQISSLVLGTAELKNLDAQVNDHLDEVLIGMNTLKYFQLSQSGNTLTLSANTPVDSASTLQASDRTATMAAMPSRPKTTTIKKTVYCDERNVCTTTYSDH